LEVKFVVYSIVDIDTSVNTLDNDTVQKLEENAQIARIDIIHQVTNPGKSGHPGGGMSSTDILTYVFARFHLDQDFFMVLDTILKEHGTVEDALAKGVKLPDILAISHAHISSAYYPHVARRGILSRNALEPLTHGTEKPGFGTIDEAVHYMRSHHRQTFVSPDGSSVISPFGGHIERTMPTAAWSGGNLGQVESAAVAFAYYLKQREIDSTVIVGVGDGGSTKGQSWEAANMASILGLDNIIIWCDFNNAQVMGTFNEVSGKQNLQEMYKAAGFKTSVADGHDFRQIHEVFSWAYQEKTPTYVEFKTHMGRGSQTMMQEGHRCHGVGFDMNHPEKAEKIIEELGGDPAEHKKSVASRYEIYPVHLGKQVDPAKIDINAGIRIVYQSHDSKGKEPRKAYGAALADLDKLNNEKPLLIIGNDCDLGDSTNITKLKHLVQHGIREHHGVTFSSALSIMPDVLCFFSTFGVFGSDEVYNQLRLANANHTNLKVFLTHVGISVGEDDITHHCIDYIGLTRNLTRFYVVSVPDGNYADAITRYAAVTPGNFFVTMPRCPVTVVTKYDGTPFYDNSYQVLPEKYDTIRKSNTPQGSIITHGTMTGKALEVYDILKEKGIEINLYCAPFVKEADKNALKEALETENVFIYEDHLAHTGLGSIIADAIINDQELRPLGASLKNWEIIAVRTLGPSGSYNDLYKYHKLDSSSLAEKISAIVKG
jgi:transketolase